jgi:signal recognition particle subunit SEC65
MSREIDFSKTVYQLLGENPELVEIMKELGFESITNEKMLSTAGRFMTIPKGAAIKGISMDTIKQAFKDKGYAIKE